MSDSYTAEDLLKLIGFTNIEKNSVSINTLQEKNLDNFSVSINNNNNVNNVNNVNNGNTSRDLSLEETKGYSSARPLGQTASEEDALSQKAKGVVSSPRDLFREIQDIKDSKAWVEESHISYLKIDLYLPKPNDPSTVNAYYYFVDSFRETPCQANAYKVTMTLDYHMYIDHPRRVWSTNNIPLNYYEETYHRQKDYVKKTNLPLWAGKSLRKKSFGNSKTSPPMETNCGMILYKDSDGDYHIELQHQGAFFKLSKPGYLYDNNLDDWIKKWAIAQEQKSKGKKSVPAYTTFEFRRLK